MTRQLKKKKRYQTGPTGSRINELAIQVGPNCWDHGSGRSELEEREGGHRMRRDYAKVAIVSNDKTQDNNLFIYTEKVAVEKKNRV